MTQFFSRLFKRNPSCSGLLTRQGTLWNQSDTMKTLSRHESQNGQKLPKTAKLAKRVVFKGDNSLDAFSLFVMVETCNDMAPHMSGYLVEPFRNQ